MSADRILQLKLIGDVSSIDKSLKGTTGKLNKLGASIKSWGTAFAVDVALDGVSKLGDALSNAWDGFRSGQQVAAQLGTTWQNLGLDGSKLQETIDAISASTLKLGTSDDEAVMAFNKALQATGNSAAAMKRLKIAQDLVANGSAPNLSAAMDIIRGAAKGSSRVVDKFGLTSKTAGGRVKELGEKVKGAAKHKADLDPLGVLFNSINEDLEGIVGSLASGDIEGALKSIGQIATDTEAAWSKLDTTITPTLDKLSGGAWTDAKTAVDGFLDRLAYMAVTIFPAVGESFGNFQALLQGLQPYVQIALDAIQPLIDLISGSAAGMLKFAIDSASGAFRAMADLLTGNIPAAFAGLQAWVGTLAADINAFALGIPAAILGVVPAVADAAAEVGGSIYDGIVGWIKSMATRVVEIWNSLGGFGAGSFQLIAPQHFEVLGQQLGWDGVNIAWGAGDLIPNIGVPALAKGGIVNSPTLAMIGEAGPEAVVPLSHGGGMGATYNITVNAAPGVDPWATGKAIIDQIKAYERRSGKAWRGA